MLIVSCYTRIESTSAKPTLSLTATITEGADEELVLMVWSLWKYFWWESELCVCVSCMVGFNKEPGKETVKVWRHLNSCMIARTLQQTCT